MKLEWICVKNTFLNHTLNLTVGKSYSPYYDFEFRGYLVRGDNSEIYKFIEGLFK